MRCRMQSQKVSCCDCCSVRSRRPAQANLKEAHILLQSSVELAFALHQQTTMSSEPSNDRKRSKPTAVVSTGSNNHHQSDKKARRVSTDASASTVTSHQTTKEADDAQRNHKLSMETTGILIPSLNDFDTARAKAALGKLFQNLYEDKTTSQQVYAA
jgi:hypothetical protein